MVDFWRTLRSARCIVTAVQRDLSNILGEMFKLGEISYNKTLNDILINIKK